MKTFSQNKLIEEAKIAREKACAEFSNFKVGAVVVTESGNKYLGCNIESSSYGLTICAERVAIFKALSEGEKNISEIVVIADTNGPVSPCGACRQIMVDYASDAKVTLTNMNGDVKNTTVQELLPDSFSRSDLHEK